MICPTRMTSFELTWPFLAVTALKRPIKESRISFSPYGEKFSTNERASFSRLWGWEDFCTNHISAVLKLLPTGQRCLGVPRWPRLDCFVVWVDFRDACLCFAGVLVRVTCWLGRGLFPCVVSVFFYLLWGKIVLLIFLLCCCGGLRCVILLSLRFSCPPFCVLRISRDSRDVMLVLRVVGVLFFLFLMCFCCHFNILFRCISAGLLWFFAALVLVCYPPFSSLSLLSFFIGSFRPLLMARSPNR